ncbi:transporter [Antrihabitans sp. YC2-6]|nr:transporter [Antrihabitans sp. YC2-6]
MTVVPHADVLAFVERSPEAVARHDKQAWLALFARRHIVEDPVGGEPVVGGIYDARSGGRGTGALARFWETFIATRTIRFRFDGPDIVRGLDVVRNVTIEIRDDEGVELHTPAYLLYQLTVEGDELKIARLAAHWEVGPVLGQSLGVDRARLRSMAQTSRRLLAQQHLGGAVAFGGAIRSVGDAGKAAVAELVSAAEAGDGRALTLLGGVSVTGLEKVIAAGDVVCASCTAAGEPAVLMCYFDRKRMTVVDVDVYRPVRG